MDFELFTLTNLLGTQVNITNYGGIVTSVLTLDKNGHTDDIVLGFDKPEDYQENKPYFGALIGRYANRIAHGKFALDGQTYTLAINNGPNHLHGGSQGFDKVFWDAEFEEKENKLKLTYRSPDGEEGYPGNLQVSVVYRLTDDNRLIIAYEATTDQATPVNLTNHSYFNLAGHKAKNIVDHVVYIDADQYIPVDEHQIPTGKIKAVQDTPFDFTQEKVISKDLDQIPGEPGGYDHTYVLNKPPDAFALAARVYEPQSGRTLEVYTTAPGMQFYTGNFLDGSVTGKGGKVYEKHTGFCMETQYFPDAPNQPNFPDVILRPGETYQQTTAYVFGVADEF